MLLLDQGLPRSSVELLREKGWDVVHVSEVGLSKAEDKKIIEYAIKTKRVIVTLDADFHALLAVSNKPFCTVIRIREEGLRAEDLVKLLLNIWPKIKKHVAQGVLISVTSENVRIRHLPILR